MSVSIDLLDVTQYVRNIKPGHGFKQSYTKDTLALKPGSSVYNPDLSPGLSFTLNGLLWSDTQANLWTLIDNMNKWLRPRKEPYRIDYHGHLFYAYIVNLDIEEPNLYSRSVTWEATFESEEPTPVGTYTNSSLAQDTIVALMNAGPGVSMPTFEKTITGSVVFEVADRDGALAASLGGTQYSTNATQYSYGTISDEFEYRLLPRASTKWVSGASHSGSEGGLYWSPSSTDLSAENCYTLWVAILVDKDLISGARIGLGDGTDTGWVSILDRIDDGQWSWIPVFVREAEKANGSYDSNATTRVYVAFTPNSASSVTAYICGNLLVKQPAKLTLAASVACYYDLRTGRCFNRSTGAEIDPSMTLVGKPWLRPGANLFYQNSSATAQAVTTRSAV